MKTQRRRRVPSPKKSSDRASSLMNGLPAETAYRRGFFVSALIILLLMAGASRDYGISWDEPLSQEYSSKILRFYLSMGADRGYLDNQANLHLYGNLFEVVASGLIKITAGDPYQLRHLLNSLFGFVNTLFAGLLAKSLGGWRAGWLALIFMFLSPVLFGHSMYNFKDIPFSAAYAMSVYFLLRLTREIPNPRPMTCMSLALSIAMAINIRVGGLVLIVYLLFFYVVALQPLLKDPASAAGEWVGSVKKSAPYVAAVAVGAYFLGLTFWPFGLANPLSNPFTALRQMSHYSFGPPVSLFDGTWMDTGRPPWYYIPTWIWITAPLFIPAGLLLTPILYLTKARQGEGADRRGIGLFVLLFTALFPIAYVIAVGSNLYNGWRQLFFIYPPLVALCATAWSSLLDVLEHKHLKVALCILLALFMAEPGIWIARNHPHESFYFSPVIGGTKGAFQKYEIDYWGTSLRAAVEWIAANGEAAHPGGKIPIRTCFGLGENVEHFVKQHSNLSYVPSAPSPTDWFVGCKQSSDWAYTIVLPEQARYEREMAIRWPPQGTVHQIAAGGAPLAAIVKNFQAAGAPALSERALMDAGLDALYAHNDPAAAIMQFQKVLEINPTHYGATYQLATALDRAGKPAQARPLWEKMLRMAEQTDDQKILRTVRERLARQQ